MDIKCREVYDSLWNKALSNFMEQKFEYDTNLLNLNHDTRRGLTLVGRLSNDILKNINKFLMGVKSIEKNQYYYEINDIHLTVMSIVTSRQGYLLSDSLIPQYDTLIQKSLIDVKPFKIRFYGITASNSCIMLQGFPLNNELEKLRNNLRNQFNNSNIEQNMDSRYLIETAHSTIIRFKTKIENPKELIDYINKFREFDFGTVEISKIELVYNDWYMTSSKLRQLKMYTCHGNNFLNEASIDKRDRQQKRTFVADRSI